MLVDSQRLTDEDRAAWAVLETADMRAARSPRLTALTRTAMGVIRRFIEGDAYVSVSWGKDSVVIAHLARMVDPSITLVHGALDGHENPDSGAVAAEYLSRWPMPYSEVVCPWVEGVGTWHLPISRAHGYRRIMGIRASESGTRKLSAAVHGHSTATTCRPILLWSEADVFGYLARHDLPVHPVYAMSIGGRMDRMKLRVDCIGGREGVDRGRRDWERRYFPDLLGC